MKKNQQKLDKKEIWTTKYSPKAFRNQTKWGNDDKWVQFIVIIWFVTEAKKKWTTATWLNRQTHEKERERES